MDPKKLQERLKAQQTVVEQARTERAEKATARDQAQKAWAEAGFPTEDGNEQYTAAKASTADVDAADAKVEAEQNVEREILGMLAQRDPDAFQQSSHDHADSQPLTPRQRAAASRFDVMAAIVKPNEEALAGLSRGGKIQRVELGTIPREVTAGLLTTAGLGGAVPADNRGIIQPIYDERLIIQQLGAGTTNSNNIEYFQAVYTRAATGTPESTTVNGAKVGVTKPEATVALTKADAPVRTIAVWVPAHRNTLADLPGMQALIEGLLENDVNLAVEEQAVAGDGTGDDLLGILNNDLIGHVELDANGDLMVGIRKGMTKIRLGKGRPNFVAMNPEDWEEIVLTREDETDTGPKGQYLLSGPGAATNQDTIWRLPVIESESIPKGSPLVGDGRGASLLVREDTTVALSEHDGVNFRQNLVTIRAEARVAMPVWRPGFFCQVEKEQG